MLEMISNSHPRSKLIDNRNSCTGINGRPSSTGHLLLACMIILKASSQFFDVSIKEYLSSFNGFAEWKHECDNESEAVIVVYRMK